MDWRSIAWDNPDARISHYFTVKEALWLSSWSRLAYPGDGLDFHVKERICILAEKLDVVREYIGRPMHVHSWFRPKGYNALVGGAVGSKPLSSGLWSAVDFHCALPREKSVSASCASVRAVIEPKLDEWSLRMEDHDGPWIHIDDAPVVTRRFFRP